MVSRDGQCILVSCVASTVKLFDKSTGEMLQEYSGHINKDYRQHNCKKSYSVPVLYYTFTGSKTFSESIY